MSAPSIRRNVVRKATKTDPSLTLIRVSGVVVGMIEKYRDTRNEWHPYKAFAGIGVKAAYLGAYYDSLYRDSLPDDGDMLWGGESAAVDAILDYHGIVVNA